MLGRIILVCAIAMLMAGRVGAKVTALQDWNESSSFGGRVSDSPARKYQVLCENFGGVSKEFADDHEYICNGVFSPMPTMICYRDCVCGSRFSYTKENCRASNGRVPGGESCMGTHYTQCNCDTGIYPFKAGDPACKSQSGVCTGDSGTYYSVCNK